MPDYSTVRHLKTLAQLCFLHLCMSPLTQYIFVSWIFYVALGIWKRSWFCQTGGLTLLHFFFFFCWGLDDAILAISYLLHVTPHGSLLVTRLSQPCSLWASIIYMEGAISIPAEPPSFTELQMVASLVRKIVGLTHPGQHLLGNLGKGLLEDRNSPSFPI